MLTFQSPFKDSMEYVVNIADKLVEKLKLNVVERISHKFEPHGITLVYVLSQSHLVIHTWPESNTLHIDLISCKKIDKIEIERVIHELVENPIKQIRISEIRF